MSGPGRVTLIEVWETIAFTALPPGWVNLYKDGDSGEMATPCPGVLVQEFRKSIRGEDHPTGGNPPYRRVSTDVPEDPPYETRTVFADYDGAYLAAADDAANYERTEYRP